MAGCMMCQIVSGELQVNKIVETGTTIGYVAHFWPMSRGHCVFFPRRHAPNLHDLEDRELIEIILLVKRAAAAMGLESYNVLQNNGAIAGQTAFHAHVHLIPKWSETDGLRFEHGPRRTLDHGEIVRTAKAKLADTASLGLKLQ